MKKKKKAFSFELLACFVFLSFNYISASSFSAISVHTENVISLVRLLHCSHDLVEVKVIRVSSLYRLPHTVKALYGFFLSKFSCLLFKCSSLLVLLASAGVLPPHSDSHVLVGGYRKEQYQDILGALEVMRYIHPSTPSIHVYLRMFQLESQVLPRCSEILPPVRSWSRERPIWMPLQRLL